ncbi:unnamed protein product [Caenorhabditis auriculariae]|uniref:TGF-beta family profile domain-containing protein n=1 Tax=Caenorhabditis auriculariae TaxID=2777116 RepID=A0A8S1GVV8_9PELO|nr:unnamed protein product [Caenorhabditis auriculariae]
MIHASRPVSRITESKVGPSKKMLCRILLLLLTSVVADLHSPGHSGGCSSNCIRGLELRRIEQVKTLLLLELGLRSEPNMTQLRRPSLGEIQVIRALIDAEKQSELQSLETRYVIGTSSGGPATANFASPIKGKIDSVKLTFYVNISDARLLSCRETEVKVFERNVDGTLGPLLVSSTYRINNSKRIAVDIAVSHYKRWQLGNKIPGIYVEVLVDNVNVAVHPRDSDQDEEKMVLATKFSTQVRRRRDAAPVCPRENPSAGCCMYDFEIDFEKIGWSWIIAPRTYNAYLCRGDCTLNGHHMHRHGHTKLVRATVRQEGTPDWLADQIGTCCHATDYEPLTVVYVNQDGFVSQKDIPGMIARRCSCS